MVYLRAATFQVRREAPSILLESQSLFPATALPNSCENNLDKDYTHGTRKHPVTLTWYCSADLDVLLGNSNPADALCPAPFPCEAPRLCARDSLEVSAPARWHLVGAVRLAEPAASVSADCT